MVPFGKQRTDSLRVRLCTDKPYRDYLFVFRQTIGCIYIPALFVKVLVPMPRPAAPPRRRTVRRISGRGDYKVRPMVSSARPRRALRGHGDYTYDKPGPWGKAGRWIGNALGSHFAGSGGGKLGEKIGSYAHYLGKIFGSGDYVTAASSVKSNTLVNSSQVPQFANGLHTMKIQHREYLGDIFSSGTANTFAIQDYAINPGQVLSYPWLANVVGVSYQQYRINGQVYEFRSMSSDALNSTNTALGSVAMATDYDSKDNTFVSKAQMENTEFGVSCKPSCNMIHAIECARNQTSVSELYMRPAGVPSGADQRLYDLGRFSIASTGMQGTNVNLGELWVSYDIDFLKPIQLLPLANGLEAAYEILGTDATHPLGTSSILDDVDSFGLVLPAAASTSGVIAFPANLPIGTTFMFHYQITGNSTNSVAAPVVTWAHGLSSIGNTLAFPASGTATASVWYYSSVIRYTGGASASAPPTATISAGVVPASGTGILNLMQVSGNVLNDILLG
nr:putative capsid protein [Crucivirus sp.]